MLITLSFQFINARLDQRIPGSTGRVLCLALAIPSLDVAHAEPPSIFSSAWQTTQLAKQPADLDAMHILDLLSI
jgi:hypothetical protein